MARKFTHEQAVSAIVVSYYWHFVDVVWIALFATIYLIASGSAGTAPPIPDVYPFAQVETTTGEFSITIPAVILTLDHGRFFLTLPWSTALFRQTAATMPPGTCAATGMGPGPRRCSNGSPGRGARSRFASRRAPTGAARTAANSRRCWPVRSTTKGVRSARWSSTTRRPPASPTSIAACSGA